VTSSYRTYIAGHSVVGIPIFSYLKTPFLAGGVTSMNPDTQDLFLEEVKDEKYLSSDGTWKDVQVLHEVIKVRFGSDVHFDVKYTENGVLLPKDLLHKQVRSFSQHLSEDVWESDELLWNSNFRYALATVNDPLTHHNLGPGEPFANWVSPTRAMHFQATWSKEIEDPREFIKKFRRLSNMSVNCIYVLEKQGDILYFPGGGLMPKRKNNVVGGVYPKIGKNSDNKWQGRIPDEEMPYLINPKSGYIVSCNNHMSSSNVKHGITQSFTFPGRKTRVSEIIEGLFEKTGNKVTVKDMQSMQTDDLDVQARASLADMLFCVDNAPVKLTDSQKAKVTLAKRLFKTWDFRFEPKSVAASIFYAWEFHMAYYLHEKKITSPMMRVQVSYGGPTNQFTWLSIQQWAAKKRTSGEGTRAEYCALNEIPGDDCLNFMVYTLVKGMEDIEGRLGPYNAGTNNWRYGLFATMRLEHQPFTTTPLRRFFDKTYEGRGSKRTVNLFFDVPYIKDRYEANAGSIVRFIADFNDHTSIYVSNDCGDDQNYIWRNSLYNSMSDFFEQGKLFRLPTEEVQDQIRFKLLETAPDLYLYTDEREELPKKKSGCPFAGLV